MNIQKIYMKLSNFMEKLFIKLSASILEIPYKDNTP